MFDYDFEDDNDFMGDLGFTKGSNIEESISKFTSHAMQELQLPTKSELMRTDSNAITEENMDYNSHNPSSEYETERIGQNEDNEMEEFLIHASNAELGFLKQSLTNIQEMMK